MTPDQWLGSAAVVIPEGMLLSYMIAARDADRLTRGTARRRALIP